MFRRRQRNFSFIFGRSQIGKLGHSEDLFICWSAAEALAFPCNSDHAPAGLGTSSAKKSPVHAFDWICSMSVCAYQVAQSCPTLCDPLGCSPPGSSVHGILQARILECTAMPSSRESSWPRDQTQVSYISCIGRWILYHWATWEACSICLLLS